MNLYQYARKTDRSGIAFYQKMAERAGNEGLRRVFNMMAEDQEELLFKLEAFRSHYPEIGEMECGVLSKMAIPFDHICDNGRCDLVNSDVEAYQLALDAERKVVEQYRAAAAQEENPGTRQMLEWIAALEQYELRKIEELHDFADAPNRSLEWGEFSNLDEFHNFGYYEDLRKGNIES